MAADDENRRRGRIFELVKKTNILCETFDNFEDMLHGFILRGDLDDEKVCDQIIRAVEKIHQFMREQFRLYYKNKKK